MLAELNMWNVFVNCVIAQMPVRMWHMFVDSSLLAGCADMPRVCWLRHWLTVRFAVLMCHVFVDCVTAQLTVLMCHVCVDCITARLTMLICHVFVDCVSARWLCWCATCLLIALLPPGCAKATCKNALPSHSPALSSN